MTDHAAFLRARDALREVLLAAAKERGQRDRLVTTEHGTECEWVGYERGAMLAEVNSQIVHLHRAVPFRDLATPDAIARVEREAAGSADYVDKYALYCAEIVVGYRDLQTGAPTHG